MCRGSIFADSTEDAVSGVVYQIGLYAIKISRTVTERNGVLHRPDLGVYGEEATPRVRCAACIRRETPVVLLIPEELQERLRVLPRQEASFLPGSDAHGSHDHLRLADGRYFKLWEFAGRGVTLTIPEADSGATRTVDAIREKASVTMPAGEPVAA